MLFSKYLFSLGLALASAGTLLNPAAAQTAAAPSTAAQVTAPAAPRELRGVWISTVYNGNWPSRPGLPVADQQKELIAIMDRAKSLNLNTIVFQVRPGCDAMYDSKLEPWSEFLTAEQGKAPQPYYDPLQFAIQEAHRRGMLLHAWFNPYRASTRLTGHFAPNHVSNTMPQAAKRLDKLMWLDPANKAAQQATINVIMDVVRRYDVDGVQFDDYFYPYSSEVAKTGGFPDDDTWQQYQAGGGKLARNDWRRENVNLLMKSCYENIKKVKPRVVFGIAPFGIWRPGHPEGIAGMDAYEQLYADAKKWYNEGYVDYMSPQLYWDLSKEKQSYPKLLAWWAQENTKHRHLWPGMSITGVGNENFPVDDITKRIDITRKQAGATGEIFFSMKPLMEDKGGISTHLKQTAYALPALVPASPWLDDEAPAAPVVTMSRDIGTGGMSLKWQLPRDPDVFLVTIYARVAGQWKFDVVPAGTPAYTFPASTALPDAIFATTVDRTGNESVRVAVNMNPGATNSDIVIPAPVTAP